MLENRGSEKQVIDEFAVRFAVEYLDRSFALGESADLVGMLNHVDTVLKDGQPFHTAAGKLENEGDHPLRGLWIVLSQRHAVHDGDYNLTASDVQHDHSQPLSNVAKFGFTGFASVRQN